MADAHVEYKRVDLQSYEARNGESFAQSFKVKTKGAPLCTPLASIKTLSFATITNVIG